MDVDANFVFLTPHTITWKYLKNPKDKVVLEILKFTTVKTACELLVKTTTNVILAKLTDEEELKNTKY